MKFRANREMKERAGGPAEMFVGAGSGVARRAEGVSSSQVGSSGSG